MGSVDQLYSAIREHKMTRLMSLLPSPHINDLYRGDGFTLLSYAIYTKEEKVVELFLSQDNIDVNKLNGEKSYSNSALVHRTPMEVAEYCKNKRMIELLNNYYLQHQEQLVRPQQQQQQQLQQQQQQQQQQQEQQHQQQQPQPQIVQPQIQEETKNDREVELDQRAELCNVGSKGFADIMEKIAGKSESEIRRMMSRGEVPTDMWSVMLQNWQELQKSAPTIQQDRDSTTMQLKNIKEMIVELQQQEKELEQRLKDLGSTISQQAMETLEALSNAEQNGHKQLKEQLKEAKENTVLESEDIGFFLNSLGMARNARKLFAVLAEDPDINEMRITDIEAVLADRIPLGDRLDIRFGIDMVKHKMYPSYKQHWKNCAVCRMNPVAQLLTEYDIKFKEDVLNKEPFSSFGVAFLRGPDLPSLLETNTVAERLKTSKAIRSMYQNHDNHMIS